MPHLYVQTQCCQQAIPLLEKMGSIHSKAEFPLSKFCNLRCQARFQCMRVQESHKVSCAPTYDLAEDSVFQVKKLAAMRRNSSHLCVRFSFPWKT